MHNYTVVILHFSVKETNFIHRCRRKEISRRICGGICCFSGIALSAQVHLLQPVDHPFPGEEVVDAQGDENAHAGIDDTIDGIGEVGLHRGGEEDDAQHHAAGLDRAGPLETGTDQNQSDDADEQQHQQQSGVATLGMEDQVEAEQAHAQKAAEDGAEEAVAATEPGAGHVRAHAKDGTDAGEGRVAVNEEIEHSTKRRRQGSLDVAHANMEGVMIVGIRHMSSLRYNIFSYYIPCFSHWQWVVSHFIMQGRDHDPADQVSNFEQYIIVILSEQRESKDLRTNSCANLASMRRSLDSISFRSG